VKTVSKHMNNDQEIQDIVAQLQRLQIRESELLQRLERLSESNNNPRQQAPAVREFAIGDRVRIKNPRFLQPTVGTISKITEKRITLLAQDGTSIVRAHKNIAFV
jgi:predicted component of type VI protein secretion system